VLERSRNGLNQFYGTIVTFTVSVESKSGVSLMVCGENLTSEFRSVNVKKKSLATPAMGDTQ
jgi:hypothetical protein